MGLRKSQEDNTTSQIVQRLSDRSGLEEYRITIPLHSNITQIAHAIQDAIHHVAQRWGLSRTLTQDEWGQLSDRMHYILNELIANIHIHGHRGEGGKDTIVRFQKGPHALIVTVEAHTPGRFSYLEHEPRDVADSDKHPIRTIPELAEVQPEDIWTYVEQLSNRPHALSASGHIGMWTLAGYWRDGYFEMVEEFPPQTDMQRDLPQNRYILTFHLRDPLKEAARILREQGIPQPYPNDLEQVQAFLTILRTKPEWANPIPDTLLSVIGYRTGPFARKELSAAMARIYLKQEWIPALERVVDGVATQLSEKMKEKVERNDLGFEELKQLLWGLFFAKDQEGAFLIGEDDEADLYRWAYREIPQLLIPKLAADWVDRTELKAALSHPLKPFTQQDNRNALSLIHKAIATGNLKDANALIQHAHIDKILYDESSRALRKQIAEDTIPKWIRWLLALNVLDYSRPAILNEITQRGLEGYLADKLNTPFLEALGGDRFIFRFIDEVLRPGVILIHLPDNNGQLVGSLKFAELLLTLNPTLTIDMVLKADPAVMNDASLWDAEYLLIPKPEEPDLFGWLRQYRASGRFHLLAGAPMHGTPLNRLSSNVHRAFHEADMVFAEGEANTWNLNGLRKPIYLGLRLKWPEGVKYVFGLDLPKEVAETHPPAFIRIDGQKGPYYSNPFDIPLQVPKRTIRETVEREMEHAAGLEAFQRFDPEEFQRIHPDWSDWIPQGTTELVVIPEGTLITFYRPGPLADDVEALIQTQASDPELAKRFTLVASDLPKEDIQAIQGLAVLVWDPDEEPHSLSQHIPVFPHKPHTPWRHPLRDLILGALAGRLNARPVKVLSIQTFEQKGRGFLILALQT